jgi:cell wall-associated NlpC family hydrolase
VRDKIRVLVPGLAALVAVAATLAVGPSSAARPAPSRPAPAAHLVPSAASLLHPGLVSRSPAPGLGVGRTSSFAVPVALLASHGPAVAPLGKLREADLFVVSRASLPRGTVKAISRLPGVAAAQSLDAARIQVNGKITAMLGVNPSQFRSFAARPTASSDRLWQGVADGGIAVSYTMGRLDRLPLGGTVSVVGARKQRLRVGGFGTVGVTGVDAVVSTSVAKSLGFPSGNAIVVSAPHTNLATLESKIAHRLPRNAVVEPLVSQRDASGTVSSAGVSSAGVAGVSSNGYHGYPTLSSTELVTMLRAALSKQGRPYVWGGSGPLVFDCSGLVQWSFAQAGIVMPRVAADQALTGPAVPLSKIAAGDLLFYHTDPTDPKYISHVAIYLGHGLMEQAPEPGMDVQVVPIALGAGFAGAVRVDPQIALSVARSVG